MLGAVDVTNWMMGFCKHLHINPQGSLKPGCTRSTSSIETSETDVLQQNLSLQLLSCFAIITFSRLLVERGNNPFFGDGE